MAETGNKPIRVNNHKSGTHGDKPTCFHPIEPRRVLQLEHRCITIRLVKTNACALLFDDVPCLVVSKRPVN
jgi:hypothetical protein